MDLAAIDVFPAHVEDAAVGQHPGRVVVVVVAGEHADVLAVAVAAVERRHASVPAVDEPPASRRAEDDAAVGAVGRLDVVVGPVGQLHEPAAVDIDFVEVERVGSAGPVGEEDLLAVVVHLRIADAALGIVEKHLHLAGAKVQAAEPRPFAVAPVNALLVLEAQFLRGRFANGRRSCRT